MERLDLGGNWMSPEGGMAICRLLEENDYITEMVCTAVNIARASIKTKQAESSWMRQTPPPLQLKSIATVNSV